MRPRCRFCGRALSYGKFADEQAARIHGSSEGWLDDHIYPEVCVGTSDLNFFHEPRLDDLAASALSELVELQKDLM